MNFRDVGEALGLWLDPSPIPPGRLLRGGRFDALSTLEDLGSPRTILNLRQGPDPTHVGITILHHPAPNDVENYQTSLHRVSAWVSGVLETLASPQTAWPVYLHCTSGRDRTGVIVAAALLAAGVSHDIIIEEYLLSEGADRTLITNALQGLTNGRFCQTHTLHALRQRLLVNG